MSVPCCLMRKVGISEGYIEQIHQSKMSLHARASTSSSVSLRQVLHNIGLNQ